MRMRTGARASTRKLISIFVYKYTFAAWLDSWRGWLDVRLLQQEGVYKKFFKFALQIYVCGI